MKRVLIVSPHWPPVSLPDLHRVRMSLPHFEEFGWEAHVLHTDPEETEGSKDPLLALTIPENAKTYQAQCFPHRLTGWLGLHSPSIRSFFHLRRLGSEIIEKENIDLIYFSTTMFAVMLLGPYWQKRYDIPFVVDLQDPWLNDYYTKRKDLTPPGGRFKYALSHFLASRAEPRVFREAFHVVSVSPSYPRIYRERYPWLDRSDFTVLPFGAAETDYEVVDREQIVNNRFARDGKYRNWVYTGAINDAMHFALRAVFRALQIKRNESPGFLKDLRLHFIGTNYAAGKRARKTVVPIAEEFGLQGIVQEHPERIPYLEALQCLRDADALFLPGSDDPGYTASKLYPYILAGKPILGVFHEESSVVSIVRETRSGRVVPFKTGDDRERVARAIVDSWLCEGVIPQPQTNWEAFEPYTAREMTRAQVEVFNDVLDEYGSW